MDLVALDLVSLHLISLDLVALENSGLQMGWIRFGCLNAGEGWRSPEIGCCFRKERTWWDWRATCQRRRSVILILDKAVFNRF